MTIWIFSSKDLENIKVAKERLMWGFWDREAGEKMRKNWRDFIRLYNKIKPFDIILFQIAKTGEIHAIGIVKNKYYDDQTPVWPIETKEGRVLFPWRIGLSFILLFENPIKTLNIKIQDYVDGYGLGRVEDHEFQTILQAVNDLLQELKGSIKFKV